MQVRDFTTKRGEKLSFSLMGCGGTPFGDVQTSLGSAETANLANAAWKAGIRYFDTAPWYGHGLSELRLGPLLQAFPRDEFLLSTKVGKLVEPCSSSDAETVPYFHPGPPPRRIVFDYSYDGVMRSFAESMTRLGLESVDILLVHDVDPYTHGSLETSEIRIRELVDLGGWQALDELRKTGLVKAIGAGVNDWEPCVRLLELTDPDLFLLAGRYTLLEQTPLHTLFPHCRRRGVGIVLGGPYNSGVLARKGGEFNYGPAPAKVIALAEKLRAVSERYGLTLAEAAIQFLTALPEIVCILPGHNSLDELAANVANLDTLAPPAMWDEMRAEGLIDAEAPVPGETVDA
jgi:D-threo-aldose 1-dehydrogenase